jgi:hypothetical protein
MHSTFLADKALEALQRSLGGITYICSDWVEDTVNS